MDALVMGEPDPAIFFSTVLTEMARSGPAMVREIT
jgi:hypothetical protein